MAEVPLVDLEVILRYSLAIRQESADARDVLEALDQSRAYVLRLLRDEHGNSVEDTEAAPDTEEAVAETSNGEATPEPTAEDAPAPAPAPQPQRRQALRPRRASTGNGEVGLQDLPTPLPKEEAAARRAARRARRNKQ